MKGARLHFPLINKGTRYFTFIIVGLSKNVSALALLEEILDNIRVFSFDLFIDLRRRSPFDYDYESVSHIRDSCSKVNSLQLCCNKGVVFDANHDDNV